MSDFPTRFAKLLEGLVPDRPEAFEELGAFYTYDLVFRDPIQVVNGLPDFLDMNRRLLGKMKTLSWEIVLAKGDETHAVLEWTMRGKPKFGPGVKVEGMTRALARDGLIYDHRDYWDLGELAASALPGGQRILRAVLSPFA